MTNQEREELIMKLLSEQYGDSFDKGYNIEFRQNKDGVVAYEVQKRIIAREKPSKNKK